MVDLFIENWQDLMYWSVYACFFMSLCVSFSYQCFQWICLKTESYQLDQPLHSPVVLPRPNHVMMFAPMIVWLPKTIRRKEGSGDDPDELYILHSSYLCMK